MLSGEKCAMDKIIKNNRDGEQWVRFRDTHIMLFKVPIMLCSDSQHQANYAHHFVPIMLTILEVNTCTILR